ncbi:MAG TPA: hypothetical protein VGB97_00165 [Candidatus Paceibacterota bacterium]|jgi:hypothetical protein
MSFAASGDIFDVMLGVDTRRQDMQAEIQQLQKVIDGLKGQVESFASTGYFLVARDTYLAWETTLGAQWHFSNDHDKLGIAEPWCLDQIIPELKKKIELLERFLTNKEQEGDVELAITYLSVLHREVCNAEMGPRRSCFG